MNQQKCDLEDDSSMSDTYTNHYNQIPFHDRIPNTESLVHQGYNEQYTGQVPIDFDINNMGGNSNTIASGQQLYANQSRAQLTCVNGTPFPGVHHMNTNQSCSQLEQVFDINNTGKYGKTAQEEKFESFKTWFMDGNDKEIDAKRLFTRYETKLQTVLNTVYVLKNVRTAINKKGGYTGNYRVPFKEEDITDDVCATVLYNSTNYLMETDKRRIKSNNKTFTQEQRSKVCRQLNVLREWFVKKGGMMAVEYLQKRMPAGYENKSVELFLREERNKYKNGDNIKGFLLELHHPKALPDFKEFCRSECSEVMRKLRVVYHECQLYKTNDRQDGWLFR